MTASALPATAAPVAPAERYVPRLRFSAWTIALIAAVAANAAIAVLWATPVATVVGLVLYASVLARIARNDAALLALLMPFVILHASAMVSLIAIESGAYMVELGRSGHASPAGALYPVFALCTLTTAWAARQALARRAPMSGIDAPPGVRVWAKRPWPVEWIGAAIALGAALVLIGSGLVTGFPLLDGKDRLLFRSREANVVVLNLLNLKSAIGIAAGVGAAYARTHAVRRTHIAAFAAYLLASFLYGDKFFIIITSSAFFAMPFVVRDASAFRRTARRIAPALAVVVAAMVSVTCYIYSDRGALGIDATLERLADRVAAQGQLWFVAVEDSSRAIAFEASEVALNLAATASSTAATFAFDERIAAFHFVERYSPEIFYQALMHNAGAVTPTMVLEPYGLVLFGYFGLAVLLLLLGWGLGLLATWLASAIRSGDPVNCLLPGFVLAQSLVFAAQGTFYSIFSVSTAKQYAAFLLLQIVFSTVVRRMAPTRGVCVS